MEISSESRAQSGARARRGPFLGVHGEGRGKWRAVACPDM